jgi:hypothetical protein
VSWREQIELRAGVRHDERLRREGALADFRDPTGRIVLCVTALPLRRGPPSAGAAIEYERAMLGTDRLRSAVHATIVGRLRIG